MTHPASDDGFERRARNATEITAEVDFRMYQWSRFARNRFGELGYPRESISTKLLREITLGINSQGGYRPDPEWPSDVIQTERCLTIICRAHPRFSRLVEVTYLVARDEPNESRARRLRVSLRRYKELLTTFRRSMWGALASVENGRGA